MLNQANIGGKEANCFGWEINSKRMRAGSEVQNIPMQMAMGDREGTEIGMGSLEG